MEINLKFEYKDLTTEDLEILLQHLQEDASCRGGMVYSITKIKKTKKTMEIKKIEKEMMDAIMYADMVEDDFWATSTISPQEAKNLADAWCIIFNLRNKSIKKQKEFSKKFALEKEGEQ